MRNSTCSLLLAVLQGAAVCLWSSTVQAQLLPADVGATVSGFQDDFDGGALNPNWMARGASVFSVSGGMLHVASTAGDPNHLLYELGGYNNSVQEVLARIRVTNFGSGDGPRGGLSAVVDTGTSQGINLMFRDEPALGQRHFEFLDDARLWGTEFAFNWQNNTWYWLRLRHEPNAASQGGVNDVFGKIWVADGTQAEPAAWQMTYDYIPARTARTGFAGLAATSLAGTADFDVDYVLIKAAGLPNIVVAPNSFVQTPVAITSQPQSRTVLQCQPVAFEVTLVGTPPFTFQWYKDGVAIPGGTGSSYSLTNVQFTDVGNYRVVVSNVAGSTTSSNATLTVSPDTSRPVLLGAANAGLDQILVTFSEPVTASTANDRFNYSITNLSGSLQILSATLAANQTNVMLITTGQVEGVMYTLTVNDITDQCEGNVILANSQATFMAVAYTSATIGSPQPAGGAVAVPGGLNVTAGGRDIGGTNDQFQFSYQTRVGDFDVKVRLDSLSLADAWSEAGLLAREDLNGGSRFASVMATPNISGSYFQSRSTVNGAAALTGSFPVNYPNTWLRLRRTGNQFTGYAGLDGENWTQLGSASIAMPTTVSLGFAASSHNTNQTTTAAFRDFANVTTAGVNSGPLPAEPLGQSSRRTSLVISEIMFNPLDRADGRNVEFIELFNALGEPQDISGYRLDGAADFTFPPNTVIPSGGFLVVAQEPADVQAVYGLAGVLGPFSNTNSLPNDRGTVELRHRTGAMFLEANYDTEMPWPIAADGAGHSLVLARPSFGERNVEAWAASDSLGGSPGRLDPVTVDPLRNVVINEFLAHTDEPAFDFIELYNHGNQPANISGCFLSDARNTNKFTIPPNTILPPRGFVSFNQNQLGFALSSGGERIFFRNAAKPESGVPSRVLDAVRFEAQANGVSSGRYPDGAPVFSELAATTPGANNAPLLIRDVVINEIMYNPISRDSDDEFIELHNRGGTAANLGGWQLAGGIGFTFPANASVPAGGYLVIARNAARLISRNPALNANNTLGDFNGSLANGGERIVLAMPDPSFVTNGNVITTNFNYVVVDEVTYRDGGRWGQWSDGGGSSLELIDARSDNRLAANWADSDETAKAPWTTVEVRGVLDNGTSTADQLQTLLQGPGECLIDDVEVRTLAGVNVIANSTFEGGATGWTAEGTQEQSGAETSEGFNSARSYHVRATDRGDNQVNRIRTPLTAVQSQNHTNTIRAKVRWLRGHPEILFRLRGNWHEAAVSMDLPTSLGTPGAVNSRAVPNAPPAIHSVAHHPPVPAANESVVITARVHDPDGVASVQARYRLDPNAAVNTLTMLDDGTGGDAVAGDGLYSATLTGQATGRLVAFSVQATDGFNPNATATFPNNAPTRECLVRFGESLPAGNFPSYRMWMTQASFNAWDTRNNLNNTMNDVTMVFGNHRAIYNAGSTYAGSPYIAPGFNTPTGSRCGYAIDLPADDRFLGDAALQLDWPGGHGNENTAIQEQMAYWMADQMNIAYSHRYFIRLTVNGVIDMQRNGGVGTVFEGVIQPGADFIEQWMPGDSEGDFFRIDRAFEFTDAGGLIGGSDPEPQLRIYTTPDLASGGLKKKTEKYRWYWLKRAFETANDYTNVFAMADALNTTGPEPYTSHTEALADVEQWMGIFCAEHIINNFDSWGHDIGKNMYMFFPQNGRAQLYMFDLDWLMLVAPGGPGGYTATTGPLFSSDDPTVTRMFNHPPFRRAYFRAAQSAVSNAFVASKYEAAMDAKYASLVANGITYCDGQNLAAPTAVKTWFSQRRTYLVGQLNGVAANFGITNNGGNDFTVNTNLITLSGTAPIGVKGIRLNGTEYPVTWTSVSNWTMRLLLNPGQTSLALEAYDASGNVLSNLTDTISVTSTATAESPEGRVVINEIMFNPKVPDAEFVEIHNTSATTAFDLSGWRLNGVDFTFPNGTIIDPRGYRVVTKDVGALITAYGSNVPPAGVFDGQLDDGGETLSLIRPGATPDLDTIIDLVTFDDDAPWPGSADGGGFSLQLIDANQDNTRVANWSDGSGWRLYSLTGVPGNPITTNLNLFLAAAGDVHLDNISLVEGTVPGVGVNLVQNGNFESGSLAPWAAVGNHAASAVSDAVALEGSYSLRVAATGIGSGGNLVSQYVSDVVSNLTYTFSFWFLPSTNGSGISFRLTLPFRSLTPVNYRPVGATPGLANAAAGVRPPFPPLWLNELLPNNLTGLTDNAGDRDPWVEIYNAGASTISLDGWHLSDNYTNLPLWAFPANASIGPGQFLLVWLDGEPGETTAGALHASFRISPTNGSVALVFPLNSRPAVLDYINYNLAASDRSVGFHPDGEPGPREIFYFPTPGATNNPAAPPLRIYINEWMAANTSFLVDPTDSTFDDWFELYNPNATNVDLTGYALSDRLTGTTGRWNIPAGTTIPSGGFLFVWADEDTGQNATDPAALHAGFRLSQNGEAIGLFAPDGSLVDSVTFLAQTNNVSQGRWPDGNASLYFMPTPTPRAGNVIPTQPPADIRIVGTSIAPSGNLVITWSAEAGKTYQVQFKEDLNASGWTDLANVLATGSLASQSIPRGAEPRGFYRIQLQAP